MTSVSIKLINLNIPFKSNVYGSVHRKYIPIYIQQDATLHTLFISANCSTRFGWYLHPSEECIQLYLRHLVFGTPLLLPAAIVEELELGIPTPPR
jgi:hypothetical protein